MRQTATVTHPSRTPAPGRYRVDPARTTIRFHTRHLFGLGAVRGRFSLHAGEIVVGESVADTSVRAVVDATSMDTSNSSRDRAVRSVRFLDTARYPHIEFVADGVGPDSGSWMSRGTLVVRGVPAPCEVRVNGIDGDGSEFTIRATTTVDRYAHSITAVRAFAGRRLKIEITAVASR